MQELNGERPKTKVGVLQESTREEAAKGVSPPPVTLHLEEWEALRATVDSNWTSFLHAQDDISSSVLKRTVEVAWIQQLERILPAQEYLPSQYRRESGPLNGPKYDEKYLKYAQNCIKMPKIRLQKCTKSKILERLSRDIVVV